MTLEAGVWAVVPAKNFNSAKTRLGGVLQAEERSQLSRAMLQDVLSALLSSNRLAGAVVVTADSDVANVAIAAGARVFRETATHGPATAVTTAAQQLARNGQPGIIGIMADVPLVTSAEIEQLLALHGVSPAVTLVPSSDGVGTNAVVCSPPDIIELSFGGNSLATHLQTAKRHGIQAKIVNLPGLGLDLDQPDDLRIFIKRRSVTRTARYLSKQGLEERYSAIIPAAEYGTAKLLRARR